jgi:hypothetical protein
MELQTYLISNGYIPLDKSWIIRMGALDLLNGYKDIVIFLDKQENLGGDLNALNRIAKVWDSDEPWDVGESGTIYRLVFWNNLKTGKPREILTRGTLTLRCKNMDSSQSMLCFNHEHLLILDNQTSQWATMAYLHGDRRKVKNPPFKLQVTYDAVEHWEQQRKKGKTWEARADPTLLAQASAFLRKLSGKQLDFNPEQAEDYCFARAFGILNAENGEKMFPSLIGHETNRIKEVEKAMDSYKKRAIIETDDHRVVQAIAMLIKTDTHSSQEEVQSRFSNPGCVEKTWPKFWDFLADADNILKKVSIA